MKIKKVAKKILNPIPDIFKSPIILKNIGKIEIVQKRHPKDFIQTWDFMKNDLANIRFHNDHI